MGWYIVLYDLRTKVYLHTCTLCVYMQRCVYAIMLSPTPNLHRIATGFP